MKIHIEKEDLYKKTLTYARRLLNIRPRSTKEIRSRLKDKNYPDEIIGEVIKELEETGLLDDLRFAKLWIEDRIQFKPKGIMALRYELLEKGLPSSAINKAIKERESSFDEYVIAKELAKERLDGLKDLPKIKQKEKIHNLLQRRGFQFDIIERILEEI